MDEMAALQVHVVEPEEWHHSAQDGMRLKWQQFTSRRDAFCSDPRWLFALSAGLGHKPYGLVITQAEQVVGVLPLVYMQTLLFGRFLVSLPYVNTAGVVSDDSQVTSKLIAAAVNLADTLDVRHLELRHETKAEHPLLTDALSDKVHMRRSLPSTCDELWTSLKPKVRNQIRKGEKQSFTIHWGREERLEEFYVVFSENMRDLGTPVFSRQLFKQILKQFSVEAEFCTVCHERRPIAGALLMHAPGVTQVPSASSLRSFNSTNVNMLMYWHLLCRAIERGQTQFDFGRSTINSNTMHFKKQWGAKPELALWQYYVRRGSATAMRQDNHKYQCLIQAWKRLPLWLSRTMGPWIIRGIP